jgi:hypothetical protein
MSLLAPWPGISGQSTRGRTPNAVNLIQRRKHIRCAYWRLVQKKSTRWIAQQFRISPRTVFLWTKAALDYDDPEAQALRVLLDAGGTL